MGRGSRIRCEHQKPWPSPASANEQLQATFLILVQAHILSKTALLAWIIPNPACDSPGGLDKGVGLWDGCAFSAAQRAASVILKFTFWSSNRECNLGAPFLRVRASLPELWADVFKEARGFYSAQGWAKHFSPLPVSLTMRALHTRLREKNQPISLSLWCVWRQAPPDHETKASSHWTGRKKVMKAEEFGWEGEETASASAGLRAQSQHTEQLCREQVPWHLQAQQPEVS